MPTVHTFERESVPFFKPFQPLSVLRVEYFWVASANPQYFNNPQKLARVYGFLPRFENLMNNEPKSLDFLNLMSGGKLGYLAISGDDGVRIHDDETTHLIARRLTEDYLSRTTGLELQKISRDRVDRWFSLPGSQRLLAVAS